MHIKNTMSENDDCPICFESMQKCGVAVFRGTCGHSFHCDCLLKEFSYRNKWKCVQCTQEWENGEFLFLKSDPNTKRIIDSNTELRIQQHLNENILPPRMYAFLKWVIHVTVCMNMSFSLMLMSMLKKGSKINDFPLWESTDWDANEVAVTYVLGLEAPFFWFHYGYMGSILTMYVALRDDHSALYLLTIAEYVQFQIMSYVSNAKMKSRLCVFMYLFSTLSASQFEFEISWLRYCIMALMSGCGCMQLIVSQDEHNQLPHMRIRIRRGVHICALKFVRLFVKYYSIFMNNHTMGALFVGSSLLLQTLLFYSAPLWTFIKAKAHIVWNLLCTLKNATIAMLQRVRFTIRAYIAKKEKSS